MAVLSPSFPFRMANIPPPTPSRDPKKIVRRAPLHPRNAPIIAMSLMSPPPRPSIPETLWYSAAVTKRIPPPATPPPPAPPPPPPPTENKQNTPPPDPPPRQGPLPVAPGKERQQDPRGKAPEGELVGNDPVVDVDEDDRHEEREENEVAYQRESDAVPPGEQGEPGPGERLHAGIAPGDPVSATCALPPQEEKAEEGNVLRRPDGTSARGAPRCRQDDRLLPGKTVYEHVEKAPQARAEYEHPGQEQGKERHLRATIRTRHLKSFR